MFQYDNNENKYVLEKKNFNIQNLIFKEIE
jgi:hypothetical protein